MKAKEFHFIAQAVPRGERNTLELARKLKLCDTYEAVYWWAGLSEEATEEFANDNDRYEK